MTITHNHPLRTQNRTKIAIFGVLFVILLVVVSVVYLSREHAQKQDVRTVPGCREVLYPDVCSASYKRCNNIGLNDACLAVAQLDGMSQNNKTGDKPVERVHN